MPFRERTGKYASIEKVRKKRCRIDESERLKEDRKGGAFYAITIYRTR